jgi:hypothetical protein
MLNELLEHLEHLEHLHKTNDLELEKFRGQEDVRAIRFRGQEDVKKQRTAELLAKSLILNGGQRRDRTADAGLFRAALYH